jgi:DNA-directed RNA polymerase subunit N (RpoN/RPB10)
VKDILPSLTLIAIPLWFHKDEVNVLSKNPVGVLLQKRSASPVFKVLRKSREVIKMQSGIDYFNLRPTTCTSCLRQFDLSTVSAFDEYKGSKQFYLDKYRVMRQCCRRLFMSPSHIILVKQNDKCVFKFSEKVLSETLASNPYEGGTTVLKFARSTTTENLIVSSGDDDEDEEQEINFVTDDAEKFYPVLPGVPYINKSVKPEISSSSSGGYQLREYTDRIYLIF